MKDSVFFDANILVYAHTDLDTVKQSMEQIKTEYLKRMEKKSKIESPCLIDILSAEEGADCVACLV